MPSSPKPATLDVRPLLAQGVEPFNAIIEAKQKLQSGRSLCCGHRLSPAPLQKALEAVQSLGRDERLILHTRFRPVHFFERIDEATTDYDCEEVGPNHWVTTLWRISA